MITGILNSGKVNYVILLLDRWGQNYTLVVGGSGGALLREMSDRLASDPGEEVSVGSGIRWLLGWRREGRPPLWGWAQRRHLANLEWSRWLR